MNRRIFLSSVIPFFLLNQKQVNAYTSSHKLGLYQSHKFVDYKSTAQLLINYKKGVEVYQCVYPSIKYYDRYKNIEQIMGRRKFSSDYLANKNKYRYETHYFRFESDIFEFCYDIIYKVSHE